MEKIIVAYSGGLDTSVILKWLKEKYNYEIIAYCADVGQEEELDGLEEKALATGASKCIIDDLQDKLSSDFIYPMFQAGAIYENQYLLGTSIARPCIAEGMVRVAKEEGASLIAHGATGKGNDQVRFELAIAALAPKIKVLAPWRIDEFREEFPGRSEMISYAEKNNIPVEASSSKSYSMDRNLLHISYESGILEDPWQDSTTKELKSIYKLTNAPEDAPDEAEYISLFYDKGDCIGIKYDKIDDILKLIDIKSGKKNGDCEFFNPKEIFLILNQIAKIHGIGRIDIVENRFVGMKNRGVYETPGGTILYQAHRNIESLTMDREVMRIRDSLIPEYSTLVYNGFWFAPERLAIQALVNESQKNVSGQVRLKLYKGNIMCAGVKSPNSLYDFNIASMEATEDDVYDQNDATGFINLNALRLKTWSLQDKKTL